MDPRTLLLTPNLWKRVGKYTEAFVESGYILHGIYTA